MPLWFVRIDRKLYMTNAATSPTVRNIKADPRVVVLLEDERGGRCLRIRGVARYLDDSGTLRRVVLHELLKYHLAPGALLSASSRPARIPEMIRYYVERRDGGVIEVSPNEAEFVDLPWRRPSR